MTTTTPGPLFFYKDKSGRGFTAADVELDTLLSSIDEDDPETDYDGTPLHEWAAEAEVGDEWESATDKYIRTT
jgi:hypothetical protein